MGRTEPSVGQPPAGFRKDARAKKARATINQRIPPLLATHPRARKGIEQAELIVEPPPMQQPRGNGTDEGEGEDSSPPRLSLRVADTLAAARALLEGGGGGGGGGGGRPPKVAVLNMASPLSPGGGFLSGAGSQEESLCMRSTLLPSLRDEWYRLPELGAIYTPDVLVFRAASSETDALLPKTDRFFVDCISAAMLRSPDTVFDAARGWSTYARQADRELARRKMRAVLRIAQAKGVTHLVLGAWGCGAHGNPIREVAAAWRSVLLPPRRDQSKKKKQRETWAGLEEAVFAIKDAGMAAAFASAFGEGLEQDEDGNEDDKDEDDNDGDYNDDSPEEIRRRELEERIGELEARIETTVNEQVRSGLALILSGLRAQLPASESSG